MRRTWRAIAALAIAGAVALACSSTGEPFRGGPAPVPTGTADPLPDAGPQARTATEVARQEVGPAGGTVSGAGATLEIPPGALAAPATIVIETLEPSDVALPSELVGSVYAFGPDDVTFLAPITVTVAVDRTKRPLVGSIALVRAPTASNQWVTMGSAPVYEPFVRAVTDHLSDWAPVASAEAIDGGPCTVKGVCAFSSGGSTTDAGAVATTATCTTINTTNELSCTSVSGSGTWTCGCVGAAPFTLTQPTIVTSEQLADLWQAKCIGTCIPQKPPPFFDASYPDSDVKPDANDQ